MTFAKRFNKGQSFNIDTRDYNYVKMSELYAKEGDDTVHKVDGMFLHKGKLGMQPVFIDIENKALVNAPAYLCDTVKEILNDEEAVNAIKAGKVGYTIREYESHGKKCYAVNWVDMEG